MYEMMFKIIPFTYKYRNKKEADDRQPLFIYYTFFTNSDFNFIAPKLGILQSIL